MNQPVGQYIDGHADFRDKAQYLAIKTTKQYLELHIDDFARRQLEIYQQWKDINVFYKSFFQKHCCVFGQHSPLVAWNCRNPSACVVFLVDELMRAPVVEEERL